MIIGDPETTERPVMPPTAYAVIDSERRLTPTRALPLRCRLASAKMRSDHPLCIGSRMVRGVWSGSSWLATGIARIIAGDSLHRVWSPAPSAPRPILKGPLPPARFHAVAASPRGTMTHLTTTSTAMSWLSGCRSSIPSSLPARDVETQDHLDDRALLDRLRSLHCDLDGH